MAAVEGVRLWALRNGAKVWETKRPPYGGSFPVSPPPEVGVFYRQFSDGYSFVWEHDSGAQGLFEILSYQSALDEKQSAIDQVHDWVKKGGDPRAYFSHCGIDDGVKIARSHKQWWPLFDEGNGDYVCLDGGSGEVVWFQHDWFDGILAPPSRVILAESLSELVVRWSERRFVRLEGLYWGVFGDSGRVEWTQKYFPAPVLDE